MGAGPHWDSAYILFVSSWHLNTSGRVDSLSLILRSSPSGEMTLYWCLPNSTHIFYISFCLKMIFLVCFIVPSVLFFSPLLCFSFMLPPIFNLNLISIFLALSVQGFIIWGKFPSASEVLLFFPEWDFKTETRRNYFWEVFSELSKLTWFSLSVQLETTGWPLPLWNSIVIGCWLHSRVIPLKKTVAFGHLYVSRSTRFSILFFEL